MTRVDRLIAIARDVRERFLGFAVTPRDLAGVCGLASMHVAAAIGDPRVLRTGFYMRTVRFMGRRARLPHQHAWCQIDATIVDPTATQFSRRNRAVHVAQADEDGRYIETADTTDAIDVIMNHWKGRREAEYRRLAACLREMHA